MFREWACIVVRLEVLLILRVFDRLAVGERHRLLQACSAAPGAAAGVSDLNRWRQGRPPLYANLKLCNELSFGYVPFYF